MVNTVVLLASRCRLSVAQDELYVNEIMQFSLSTLDMCPIMLAILSVGPNCIKVSLFTFSHASQKLLQNMLVDDGHDLQNNIRSYII